MKRIAIALLSLLCCASAQAQQIFNNPSASIVTRNANTSVATTPSGTLLTVRQADGISSRLLVDCAGAAVSCFLSGRHARGTIAAPTATQAGDNVLLIDGFSYGATAYSNSAIGLLALTASQAQTDTARGSQWSFFVTPNGSTVLSAAVLRLENDSGITIPPTVTGGSKGAGSLNATTLYRANSLVAAANDNLSFFSATSSAQLAGVISDETGSGALVFASSPTLVTPNLGVATATSINKVAVTAPTTSATLTIADGKTLTASNSLTLQGDDGTALDWGAWTATTPTVAAGSGTFTSVTASMRARKMGRLVQYAIQVQITTNGSAAGYVQVTLPATAQGSFSQTGSGIEATTFVGLAGLIGAGANTIRIYRYDGTYPGADGRFLEVHGIYEASS